MSTNYHIISDSYDIVISGMGPAALASAWEAARLGKRVLIISNRNDDFIRVQTLYLTPEIRKYLLNMIDAENSFSENRCPYQTEIRELAGISIKDLERYLLQRIDSLETSVDIMLNSEIAMVDTLNQGISIRPVNSENNDFFEMNTYVSFHILVCADGANHHSVDMANADLPNQKKIRYLNGPSPRATDHFSAYLIAYRQDDGPLEMFEHDEDLLCESKGRKKSLKLSDPMHAKNLKCDKNNLFTVFLNRFSLKKSGGKRIKIGISGEVPKEIACIEDHSLKEKEMLSYLSGFICEKFFKNIDPDNLKIDLTPPSKKYGFKKDRLKLSFFKTTGAKADKVFIEHNGVSIVLVGDCVAHPNYQTGYGINHAFSHASEFGKLLQSENTQEIHSNNFVTKVNSLFKSMKRKTSMINMAALIPRMGKSAMATFSKNSQKEMKEWMESEYVIQQKINDKYLDYNVYSAHISDHEIKVFSNAYNDVTKESGTFHEIKNAIKSAQHFICISIWNISLIQDLGMGETLGELLLNADKRGVSIFVLSWDSKLKKIVSQANKENLLYLDECKPQNLFYKKSIQGTSICEKSLLSHHQKFIITEQTAFICGMNFTSNSVDSIEHSDLGGIMWHDAAIMLEGPILMDILHEFILRWKTQPCKNMLYNSNEYAVKLLDELQNYLNYTDFIKICEYREQENCIQFLTSRDKHSLQSAEFSANSYNEIHQAMIEAINNSNNYIFMTTQYLIGCYERHTKSPNQIPLALINRIALAYKNNEDFHVYVNITALPTRGDPGFVSDSILRKQWKTLKYIIKNINEKTENNSERYITFIELGKFNELKNCYHQIYVHSKFLLTPDELIIGSANMNERSLSKNKDYECNVRIYGYKKRIDEFLCNIITEYFGSEIYHYLMDNGLIDNFGLSESHQIIDQYLENQFSKLTPDYTYSANNYDKDLNNVSNVISDEIDGCAMPWGLVSKVNLLLFSEKPKRVPSSSPPLLSLSNKLGGLRYTR